MRTYEIELVITTDSCLEVNQLLGEMCDDYQEKYGTDVSLRIRWVMRE